MVDPYVLALAPVLVPKVWGGYRLAPMVGESVSEPIGELWTMSAHAVHPTEVLNGELAGKKLDQILPELYFWGVPDPFPVLVKFLETYEPLSLQVHPDDDTANRLEGYPFGKTEAWYILDANNASVFLGLKKNKQKFIDAIEKGSPDLSKFMNVISPKKGDLIPVPAGMVHASAGSLLFAEVQQNCDITYRMYDFGRDREVHLEKASASIKDTPISYPNIAVEVDCREEGYGLPLKLLWACQAFKMVELDVSRLSSIYTSEHNFESLTVLGGEIALSTERGFIHLKTGHSCLIPKHCSLTLLNENGPAKVLRVTA